ncbi:MAG: transferrin-binding protein-like solute binding protein [Pseudomonadota bacterium]
MIRRRLILGTVFATLAISSCDGGSDTSPTPTPTPTSSPTPTPTPTPTYAALPLSSATQFYTVNAFTTYTGDPASGPLTLGAAATESRTDRVSLAISTDYSAGEYVINENGEETRFKSTNKLVEPATTVTEYSFRTTGDSGAFSQLELLNNTLSGKVTTDTALALTTVSYSAWWRATSTTGQKRITYSHFGYPTYSGDLPTTGTATYTSRVTGRLVSTTAAAGSVAQVGGTVTLSVNFATGIVTLTLNLTQNNPGGGTTAYGTMTGQAAFAVGSTQFTGSFGSGSILSGTFNGGFYGLQGKEIAISFAGSGTNSGADQRLVGVLVGAKN